MTTKTASSRSHARPYIIGVSGARHLIWFQFDYSSKMFLLGSYQFATVTAFSQRRRRLFNFVSLESSSKRPAVSIYRAASAQ
eukprot:scaffold266245_cov50-Prasinocladus_malaysianus.AAC.1